MDILCNLNLKYDKNDEVELTKLPPGSNMA